MSDADDIAISLAKALAAKHDDMEARIQAHIERAFGRAVLRLGAIGFITMLGGATATVIKVNDAIHDYRDALNGLERQIVDQGKQIAPVPTIAAQANNAQHTADVALAKIDGHLSPDPKAKR